MASFKVIAGAVLAATTLAAPMNSTSNSTSKAQAPEGVPDYVLKYAPIVYLHSQDPYLPSDFQTHLTHSSPQVDFNTVEGPSPMTLDNLSEFGGDVYLTSNDDITTDPDWIKGKRPDSSGKTEGVTSAIIVNDKGDGNVDAFYFSFYTYNWGGLVAGLKNVNFGNHVGDWEHNMIRFSNGEPQYIWYSQHSNGQAFKYSVTEKHTDDVRPVAYSANGSHALYAIGGKHDHTIPNFNLPFGVLEDHTERGIMYDPLLAAYYYKYDAGNNKFTPYEEGTPTSYLDFEGRWGDQEYPTSDKRQVKVFGQAKFSSGPTGPRDKQLNREKVCPDNGKDCILRGILVPRSEKLDKQIFEEDEVLS